MKIDYQAIYEKLAKQNGVTPQQVREDMAQAIRPGRMKTQRMNKLNGSKNRSLVRDKSLTPEEMMDFVSQCCSENENQTFFVS